MFSPRRPRLQFSVSRNVESFMRDGTVLRADIYRPDTTDSLPVLLCRTPYGKDNRYYTGDAQILAEQGYMVIVQDLRGRNTSDGDFEWCYGESGQITESNDGYDSVEWAAALPGSIGKVGTYGTSYPAWCSWRLAGADPPSLSAIYASGLAPRMTVNNYGVFDIGRRMQWMYQVAADTRNRTQHSFGPYDGNQANKIWREILRDKWIWFLPLDSIPEDVYGPFSSTMKHHLRDMEKDYWNFEQVWKNIQVDVCSMTSWWDRQAPTVEHFVGMSAKGPEQNRANHRLVIGPWSHNTYFMKRRIGALDYGSQGEGTYGDLVRYWFDCRLMGIENGLNCEPPVKFFLLNRNRWMQSDNWPLPKTEFRNLYLHSKGNANTSRGDGLLNFQTPQIHENPDKFIYDPADPVMSLMGEDTQHAPCDQSPLDGRQDILVYKTLPLIEDLLVVGPVTMNLWVSSNALDTDFVVKLIEIGLDGIAVNLSFGIIRARYRNGVGTDEFLQKNEPYPLTIELMPIGIHFRKGSRIRIDVTSSDFPNFDRNHNTGKDYWKDHELKIANQMVFHDKARCSYVVLPIVKNECFTEANWTGQ